MFNLELVNHENIITTEKDGKRLYQLPTGERFPSVTTVLGHTSDSTWLEEWRDKVGHEEADRIGRLAAARGTALHLACEQYVMNQQQDQMNPFIKMLFNQVKPILDSRLATVYGSEVPLYSRHLRLSGRCDLIGRFDDKDSIIDFKTTNWFKNEDDMTDYYIQESCYAVMFEEVYGRPISRIVTISVGESEIGAQVIIKKRDDYIDKAIARIKLFYEKFDFLGLQ